MYLLSANARGASPCGTPRTTGKFIALYVSAGKNVQNQVYVQPQIMFDNVGKESEWAGKGEPDVCAC